jgi:hypothetical protein
LENTEVLGDLTKLEILYNRRMAMSTKKPKVEKVKLPPINFGRKQSMFSGGKANPANTFVPKTFRVTQHKGG